jgi:hypothetical protein
VCVCVCACVLAARNSKRKPEKVTTALDAVGQASNRVKHSKDFHLPIRKYGRQMISIDILPYRFLRKYCDACKQLKRRCS